MGHTGTLDPFASGLLILVLGNYTKRAGEFSKLDKTYEAELILGKTSTTGDPEGEISQKSDKKPTEDELRAVLKGFEGGIMQKPHKYSAVKIDGQRAYKLARQGKDVEIKPRAATIHSIVLKNYRYPKVLFTAKVSSGTYIRSLAEDIGETLGSGAYLTFLKRTKVGKYDISDALAASKLNPSLISRNLLR